MIDAIKYTLKEYTKNGSDKEQTADGCKLISRADDVQMKIQENEVADLKIGLKVFLTKGSNEPLNEALETGKLSNLKRVQC